jgi:hypothetical protein
MNWEHTPYAIDFMSEEDVKKLEKEEEDAN